MITGSCHCGMTTFRIDGRLPERVTRCTCTVCTKRGALHAYYTPGQFSVSAEGDRIYRWRGQLVDSHFCGRCGCATYNASPAIRSDGTADDATRLIAINARLLDDFAAEHAPVSVVDGKSRL